MQPATSYPAVLGRLIARERAARGIDQRTLAAAAGVSQSTWSRIESGEIALTVEQLWAASAALQVESDWLLAETNRVAELLHAQGVHVNKNRNSAVDDALKLGLVVLGVVALAAVIASVLGDKKGGGKS